MDIEAAKTEFQNIIGTDIDAAASIYVRVRDYSKATGEAADVVVELREAMQAARNSAEADRRAAVFARWPQHAQDFYNAGGSEEREAGFRVTYVAGGDVYVFDGLNPRMKGLIWKRLGKRAACKVDKRDDLIAELVQIFESQGARDYARGQSRARMERRGAEMSEAESAAAMDPKARVYVAKIRGRFYMMGDTYPAKNVLKAGGFAWSPTVKAWRAGSLAHALGALSAALEASEAAAAKRIAAAREYDVASVPESAFSDYRPQAEAPAPAPAPRAILFATMPKAPAGKVAELVRRRRIDEDDPAIHGEHLLGYEGRLGYLVRFVNA